MKILITGSSGLIGSALIPFLESQGHQVIRLVRRATAGGAGMASWHPEAGELDPKAFDDVDAVVNLAGENIGAARWTPERKTRMRDSRVHTTKLLAETLAGLAQPPQVLVSASAVGFYGSRGDEVMTEDKPPGTGFLPSVCVAWEAATEAVRRKGIRVVNLRIGMVLSGEGGALGPMASAFRKGVGGKLGDGRQFMGWIAIEDLTRAILHVMVNPGFHGPVNAVAPHAVTNREFTKTLGKVLRRPTLFPMPAFVVRLAFGEMADALLLASARVEPARLLAGGFTFQHPKLEDALRQALRKARA